MCENIVMALQKKTQKPSIQQIEVSHAKGLDEFLHNAKSAFFENTLLVKFS